MNESENLQNTPRPLANDERLENLQRQNNLLFAALLITSFTFTAFLGVQFRRASRDLMTLQQRASEARKISEDEDARNQAVFQQLTEFARTHPDFQKQIFSKYKLDTNAAPAAVKK